MRRLAVSSRSVHREIRRGVSEDISEDQRVLHALDDCESADRAYNRNRHKAIQSSAPDEEVENGVRVR